MEGYFGPKHVREPDYQRRQYTAVRRGVRGAGRPVLSQ